MTHLPVISCDDCGKCCQTIGTPPAFFPAYSSPRWDGKFLADADDYRIWLAMPASLRDELTAFYAQGTGRSESGLPCIWYDEKTKRCRNYEWRPTTCREFEVGSEDCRDVRFCVM